MRNTPILIEANDARITALLLLAEQIARDNAKRHLKEIIKVADPKPGRTYPRRADGLRELLNVAYGSLFVLYLAQATNRLLMKHHHWTQEEEQIIRDNRNLTPGRLKEAKFKDVATITTRGLTNKMARVIGLMDFPHSADPWTSEEIKWLSENMDVLNPEVQKHIPRHGKDIDQKRFDIKNGIDRKQRSRPIHTETQETQPGLVDSDSGFNLEPIRSVEWYYKQRREQYDAEMKCLGFESCNIQVVGSVKVGKLTMMYIGVAVTTAKDEPVKHVFITNFKRKDCEEQINELNRRGVQTFVSTELVNVPDAIEKILLEGNDLYVHVDESDHGTGNKQKLNNIFKILQKYFDRFKNTQKVQIRYYSATNQELEFSSFGDTHPTKVEIVDPPGYVGAKKFLERGQVEEALPFITHKGEVTEQGKEALSAWLARLDTKPFSVVRLSNKSGGMGYGALKEALKKDCALYKYFKELKINIQFVDNNNPFYWGKNPGNHIQIAQWINLPPGTLIVVNQTCSRSTEVGFHPLIGFWHDYRGEKVPYTTKNQAMLRTAHYVYTTSERWKDPTVDMRIYGCITTFMYAAKNIEHDQYVELLNKKSNISTRVKSTTSQKATVYVLAESEKEFEENWRPAYDNQSSPEMENYRKLREAQGGADAKGLQLNSTSLQGIRGLSHKDNLVRTVLLQRKRTSARPILLDGPSPKIEGNDVEFELLMEKFGNIRGYVVLLHVPGQPIPPHARILLQGDTVQETKSVKTMYVEDEDANTTLPNSKI